MCRMWLETGGRLVAYSPTNVHQFLVGLYAVRKTAYLKIYFQVLKKNQATFPKIVFGCM